MKSRTKRALTIVSSLLAFSLMSSSQAKADQTINIDLNNFQPDSNLGADGLALPNYFVLGLSDGERVTLNISNSTGGFVGYINNGAGNSININNGAGVNVTNNTGQFGGVGNLSSVAYDANIIGSYVATVTFGAGAPMDRTIGIENALAIGGGQSPDNVLGLLALNWRMSDFDGVGPADWKQITFFNNGTPRATTTRTGNDLRLNTAGTTTEKNNVVSCTPGAYTFLNGGSTAETAKVQSYVYTLLVNGKPVSTLSSDGFKSVAAHMFPTVPNNMAGTATLDGASWNLAGMSNYSAQCQVHAFQSGANAQSLTTEAHDALALAAAAEAAAAAQKTKDIIAVWASDEAAAKKARDARLAGKP